MWRYLVSQLSSFQGWAPADIIYEPVAEHLQFIKENVRLNHVNAEIHVEGVGDKDGTIAVPYDWLTIVWLSQKDSMK